MDGPRTTPGETAVAPDEGPRLLSDGVPLLRADLELVQKPDNLSLYDVGVRGSEKRFTLYDFEVSLARMLNGRRTVSDVIESASRIGIPVTLESFRSFVRQMRAYGFLAEPEASPAAAAAPEAAGDTWTPRDEWKEEVRELYQSALRTFRMNRPAEARGYLEAMLQIQPEVPEAIALLARIEEQLAAPSAPEAAAPVPAPAAAPAPTPGEAMPLVPEADEEMALEEDIAAAAIRTRTWPYFAAAAVALVAVGSMAAIPVPCVVSAAAEISPVAQPFDVAAASAGRISEVLVAEGAWVEVGAEVLKFDEGPLKDEALRLERDQASVDARLKAAEKASSSARAKKAKAALERKEKEQQKLQALADAFGKKGDARSKKAAASARKKAAKKAAEVQKARRAFEAAARLKDVQALRDQRDALAAARAKLDDQRQKLVVRTEAPGLFAPHVRAGDEVASGAVLATVQDIRSLRARIAVPSSQADRVNPGQAVSLRFEGQPQPVSASLNKLGDGKAGFWSAEATVDNTARALPARGTALAEIRCGSRPLLSRLLP